VSRGENRLNCFGYPERLGMHPKLNTNQAHLYEAVMERYLLVIVLAILSAATPARAQTRSLDTQIPSFRIEAAACAGLMQNGSGSIVANPFAIQGVTPHPGMQVAGWLLPDTPVFEFYVNNLKTFFSLPAEFAPDLRCFRAGVYGNDEQVHFDGVQNGKYIVLLKTSYRTAYSGIGSNISSGYGGAGEPITIYSSTPYSGVHTHENIFACVAALSNGKVTSTAFQEYAAVFLMIHESVLGRWHWLLLSVFALTAVCSERAYAQRKQVTAAPGNSVDVFMPSAAPLPASSGRAVEVPEGTPISVHLYGTAKYCAFAPAQDGANYRVIQVDQDVVVAGQLIVARGSIGLAHIDGSEEGKFDSGETRFTMLGSSKVKRVGTKSCTYHLVSVYSVASTALKLDPTPLTVVADKGKNVGMHGLRLPTQTPLAGKLQQATVVVPR